MAIKIASKTETENGVRVSFANGETVSVNVDALTPEIRKALMLHGLGQKLGDAYSGCKGDLALAVAECQSVAEALLSGNWKRRGTGNVDLIDAIVRATGQDRGEVSARVALWDTDAKAEVKKHPQIKAALAAIKAERLALGADANAVLDLDDLG